MAFNLEVIEKKLEQKEYLKDKKDNEILLAYVNAKRKGIYNGLDYGQEGNGCSPKTIVKNCVLIKQAMGYISTPFHKLTRDDAITFKEKLRDDEIKATKYKFEYKDQEVNGKVVRVKKNVKYENQMKFSTKKTLLSTMKQFWAFYQEYSEVETKKQIPDIFQKLKLIAPKVTEHNIDYLTDNEMRSMLKTIKDDNLRFIYCLFIDTAARPIELANLRKSHFITNEKGNLTVKLPAIKGISGRKYTFDVLYEKDFIAQMLQNYKDNELLFDLIDKDSPFKNSPNCFDWDLKKHDELNLKMKYWIKKVTKRPMTLYSLRKTATMYWLKRSDNNVLWTQQRLGHAEGSRAIKHYITLQGIETPDIIKTGVNEDRYKDVQDDFTIIKERLSKTEMQNQQLIQQIEDMKKDFQQSKNKDINALDYKATIMSIYHDALKQARKEEKSK